MSVAIVTDSTCYLPADVATAAGLRIVPLRVSIGQRTGTESEISPGQLTAALRRKLPVLTSRPSPGQFAEVYAALLEGGAQQVVSVHLSAKLSGTWESARLAAEDFAHGSVRVVDSRSTGMALGFAVLAAARAAAAGASAADVQGAAVSAVDRTRSLFYVDSLDQLRRGGRIGTAAALFGTSLSVKPLLQVSNGEIAALEKVRTSSKALARLLALTLDAAGDGPVDVAVHHLAAADRAAALADQVRERVPRLRELYTSEVGAVVGAHLGPGLVATAVLRRLSSDDADR